MAHISQKLWDTLIVALDVTDGRKIDEILSGLAGKVRKFKVGLIPYTKFGPQLIKKINAQGGEVFLDLKMYDIPNTMIETAKLFVAMDVWGFTVHVKAGVQSLSLLKQAILKEADVQGKKPPLVVGVTELTSQKTSLAKVLRLAQLARKSNIDAVVCSVWEAKKIKEQFGLMTITPGIRNAKGGDDQERVATMKDALAHDVDYVVVGRPIVKADDYLKAAQNVLKM